VPAVINPFLTPHEWTHFIILSLNDCCHTSHPSPGHWLKWHTAGGLLPR